MELPPVSTTCTSVGQSAGPMVKTLCKIYPSCCQPFQIAIRCDGDEEFVRDALIDFEFRVGFEVFPDGGFGIVAGAPGAVGEHVLGQVFDNSIKYHAVTADAGQWSIRFQFREYMLMGMIAVETNQDTRVFLGNVLHLLDYVGVDAGALNHLDARGHGVCFDGGAVVGADIDIHTQHFSVGLPSLQNRAFHDTALLATISPQS